MKKNVFTALLPALPAAILCLAMLVIPAAAKDRGTRQIAVGQLVTVSAEGSYPWTWSFGDPSIIKAEPYTGTTQSQIVNKRVQSYDIVGLKVGTTTVTVDGYELVWNPNTGESESHTRSDTWTIVVSETCTVTFERGDNWKPVKKTVFRMEPISEPTGLLPPGYVLDGWFTDKALTRRWDFSSPVTADLTLYAGYTAADTEEYGTIGQDVSGTASDIRSYNADVNLVPVRDKKSGLWGYANKRLRLVIPFRFKEAGSFVTAEGGGARAVVKLGESLYNSYVIDERGDYIISTGYEKIELYYNRIRGVRSTGTRYDINGNEVTYDEYDVLSDKDSERLARDESTEGWGELFEYYSEGSTKWQFYNLDMQESIWVDKIDGVDSVYGRLGTRGMFFVRGNDKWGAVHIPSRRIVIPCSYDGLYYQNDAGGYITYRRGSELGFLPDPLFPPEEPKAPYAVKSWSPEAVTLQGPPSWLNDARHILAVSCCADGRMEELMAGELKGTVATFPKRLSAGWKLFFLDNTGRPLGESAVLR